MPRKPRISKDEAFRLAKAYIDGIELKGWRYEIVEVNRSEIDRQNWTIIVDRFSPSGTLVDGPEVLIVDGQSGEVRTLYELFE